jgi:hypothetical protein
MGTTWRIGILEFRPYADLHTILEIEPNAAVPGIPGDRIQRRRVGVAQEFDIASKGRRGRPRPAGIFLLRFAWQMQRQPIQALIRPLKESLNTLETNLFHGTLSSLESTGILVHDRFPKRLRAGRLAKPETLGDDDLMLRAFPVEAT